MKSRLDGSGEAGMIVNDLAVGEKAILNLAEPPRDFACADPAIVR